MAKFDLPATIDYIQNITGQDQLVYIGHSQGTLIAFAAFSTNPELAKKISLFIALAPIVTIGNIKDPYLKALAEIITAIDVSIYDDENDDHDDDVSTTKFYIFRLLYHSSMRPSFLVIYGEHSLFTRVTVTVLQRRNCAIKLQNISLEMIPQM